MTAHSPDALIPPAGTLRGGAEWLDEAGESGGYDATLFIEILQEGFALSARHVFDNGDPDTNTRLEMKRVTPELFKVFAAEQEVGKGYLMGGFCHYSMTFGENVVENNLIWSNSPILVFGSATKNAAGRHIAWRESLIREPSDDA